MGHRWLEHTAELQLQIDAPSEAAVLREALEALGELIGAGALGEAVSREIVVTASDRAALLVAWLDELVYLAETEDLVADAAERLELDGDTLRATVRAHRRQPRHLVKGATYHDLVFARAGGGFTATVVLDV
jgi:SHS2 domain-containing protein